MILTWQETLATGPAMSQFPHFRHVLFTYSQKYGEVNFLILFFRCRISARMSLIDDAALLKMAEAEILEDARKAALRHSVAGISGWQPCPKPNKVFLANTILHTMTSNKILSNKGKKPSVKHKITRRKLIKKDEKINITYRAPKKEEKQPDVNSGKGDNKVKSEAEQYSKLVEQNNKINRERLKIKSLKKKV